MLPSQPLPGYRTEIQSARRRRLSRRQVRRIEGASLWLAMLMLLFVQPLFEDVKAKERQVAEGTGEFHYLGDQGRVPALVLSTDYQVTVTGLIAETRLGQLIGYPYTTTPAPVLMANGPPGSAQSGMVALIRRWRV